MTETTRNTDEEAEGRIAGVISAFAAVKAHVGKQRGISGDIECPVCQGRLHFSVAKVNGHVWASCATEGCVRFME
jgi:hypothetical protein